jgi:isopenicillin N synthase-like dioxygenase
METDMTEEIPAIDIAPLFGPAGPDRDEADSAVLKAASGIGFMTVRGFAGGNLLTPENRAGLLRIFSLPDQEKAKLLRWNFDKTRQNFYRGWFPLQPTAVSYKEGIDMGPDIARRPHSADPHDRCASRHRCRTRRCFLGGVVGSPNITEPWKLSATRLCARSRADLACRKRSSTTISTAGFRPCG